VRLPPLQNHASSRPSSSSLGLVIHAMSGEQDIGGWAGCGRGSPGLLDLPRGDRSPSPASPPLAGFSAKDEILLETLTTGTTSSSPRPLHRPPHRAYMARLLFLTFYGEFPGRFEAEHHLPMPVHARAARAPAPARPCRLREKIPPRGSRPSAAEEMARHVAWAAGGRDPDRGGRHPGRWYLYPLDPTCAPRSRPACGRPSACSRPSTSSTTRTNAFVRRCGGRQRRRSC